MLPDEIVHFYPSEEIFEKANSIFEQYREKLAAIIPAPCDIQHVGSCAVPGAIGKFDVDIQIRIDEAHFEKAKEVLIQHFTSKHPELWKDTSAIFVDQGECQVDIILTVIDSAHDDYWKVRDFLINNPAMLEKYNTLKMQFEGKPYKEYRAAKSQFFGKNGEVNFLK